jgi:acetyl-CoA C-acetyltransferase
MREDPRTPLLVGTGVVQQREDDPARAKEPVLLMIEALERAAEDAGSRALLARADRIEATRGFWDYADPCRIVAERFGAAGARTCVAEVGVLQTTLLGRAAAAIAAGEADVVLVTGGEAKHRQQRAAQTGVGAPLLRQTGALPDEVLRPQQEIVSPLEIAAGLQMPVGQYAMIENALRAADGQGVDAHQRAVAELWSRMSRIAAENPDAWSREALSADAIREPSGRNRMLAFPYTKLHNSQWNVDQAAGLVFCSLATARTLGLPRERWVFPLAVAEANQMVPLTQRRSPQRCPGFARAGERALAAASREIGEVAHLELYSCFPSAVRVQARELGIDEARPLSVTGGMAFAGGPLNNFVYQALARMARVLRADPGSAGMLNAVSGVLTKQGVSLWSTEPAPGPFRFEDATAETAREVEIVPIRAGAAGRGAVVTYTVLFEGAAPSRSVLLCDLEDGTRALATSADPALAEAALHEELCGRKLRLSAGGEPALL